MTHAPADTHRRLETPFVEQPLPDMAAAVLRSPLELAKEVAQLRAALAELHRICLNCDAEAADSRAPTEDEYQAAMDEAERLIAPNAELTGACVRSNDR